MLRRIIILIAGLSALLMISGCLWVERAEYYIRVQPDGRGEGKVKFYNICYEEGLLDSTKSGDLSAALSELMEKYVRGPGFEQEHPDLTITGKRLYREDSILVGEVDFTFDSLANLGIWTYRQQGELLISMVVHPLFGALQTELVNSNGKFTSVAEGSPFLVWDESVPLISFMVRTESDPSSPGQHVSLADEWTRAGADSVSYPAAPLDKKE
jgi:hypothetical protein